MSVISDANSNVISNATVSVSNPALQVSKSTTAIDSEGACKFLNLPARGVYCIAIVARGFQASIQEGANSSVGFTARINRILQVGQISTAVEVTTSGPVIDIVSTFVHEESLSAVRQGAGE